MKLLAMVASERKWGNSVVAARYVAKKLGADLEVLRLGKMDIRPCKARYACLYEEECRIDDDVHSILEEVDESDAVLISSPVYMLDAAGKVKALLDKVFMAPSY